MSRGKLYRWLVVTQIIGTDVSQYGPQDVSQPFGFDINVVRWVHCLLVWDVVVRRRFNKCRRTYQLAGEQQIHIDPGHSICRQGLTTPRSCTHTPLHPSCKQIVVSEYLNPSAHL